MPEEDVIKKTLPDHITENLDIIIVSVVCLAKIKLLTHFHELFNEKLFMKVCVHVLQVLYQN